MNSLNNSLSLANKPPFDLQKLITEQPALFQTALSFLKISELIKLMPVNKDWNRRVLEQIIIRQKETFAKINKVFGESKKNYKNISWVTQQQFKVDLPKILQRNLENSPNVTQTNFIKQRIVKNRLKNDRKSNRVDILNRQPYFKNVHQIFSHSKKILDSLKTKIRYTTNATDLYLIDPKLDQLILNQKNSRTLWRDLILKDKPWKAYKLVCSVDNDKQSEFLDTSFALLKNIEAGEWLENAKKFAQEVRAHGFTNPIYIKVVDSILNILHDQRELEKAGEYLVELAKEKQFSPDTWRNVITQITTALCDPMYYFELETFLKNSPSNLQKSLASIITNVIPKASTIGFLPDLHKPSQAVILEKLIPHLLNPFEIKTAAELMIKYGDTLGKEKLDSLAEQLSNYMIKEGLIKELEEFILQLDPIVQETFILHIIKNCTVVNCEKNNKLLILKKNNSLDLENIDNFINLEKIAVKLKPGAQLHALRTLIPFLMQFRTDEEISDFINQCHQITINECHHQIISSFLSYRNGNLIEFCETLNNCDACFEEIIEKLIKEKNFDQALIAAKKIKKKFIKNAFLRKLFELSYLDLECSEPSRIIRESKLPCIFNPDFALKVCLEMPSEFQDQHLMRLFTSCLDKNLPLATLAASFIENKSSQLWAKNLIQKRLVNNNLSIEQKVNFIDSLKSIVNLYFRLEIISIFQNKLTEEEAELSIKLDKIKTSTQKKIMDLELQDH